MLQATMFSVHFSVICKLHSKQSNTSGINLKKCGSSSTLFLEAVQRTIKLYDKLGLAKVGRNQHVIGKNRSCGSNFYMINSVYTPDWMQLYMAFSSNRCMNQGIKGSSVLAFERQYRDLVHYTSFFTLETVTFRKVNRILCKRKKVVNVNLAHIRDTEPSTDST